MDLPHSTFLAVASCLAGWAGSVLIRHNAAQMRLVQTPNARSSHTVPTPQGGGIAIALVAMMGAAIASLADSNILAVAALIATVGALGLADDILDLSPAFRFPIQGLSLAALLTWAVPLPTMVLPFGLALDGWLLVALIWLAAIWWMNLFNFMDGIDGMAGTQAIIILVGGLGIALSADPSMLTAPVVLPVVMTSAATAGFLLLNWTPARIFMGDAGSNTLAALIVCFALVTVGDGVMGYPAWLILLSPFAADATTALLRRTARGERPWRAHRRHAYQQLARRWRHARVTLLYSAFALLAVLSASIAQHYPAAAWWFVGLIYACLFTFAIWGGSGDRAERN